MNMSETLSNRGNIVPWLVPIAIGVAAFALAACSTATPSPTPEGTESAGPELQGGCPIGNRCGTVAGLEVPRSSSLGRRTGLLPTLTPWMETE